MSGHAREVDVRTAYLNQIAVSYSIYTVGAVTAFLAMALALSETQAGLHSSLMAAGMIVAGVAGDRVDRLVGAWPARIAGLVLLAGGLMVLAWAPAVLVTLAASAAIGLGGGTMFGHLYQTVGAGGGTRARLQVTRAALVAKVSQLVVPLAIGLGIAISFGWQFVVVPVLALMVLLFVRSRPAEAAIHAAGSMNGRLPRAYWLPWMLTVSVIGLEFGVIVWGSTLVERQTGVTLADATLTISAFVGGLILARVLLSLPGLGRLDPILGIRVAVVLTIVAVMVPWLSSSYEISAVGMLVAGFGIGMLYPLCAAITLAAAPDQPAAASSRLVLAAGLALLVGPLVLGVVADFAGISAGWLLVPGLCVGVFALSVPVALRHEERSAATS